VLHGFQLLGCDDYYPLYESGKMVCFLGYSEGIPAATSAVLDHEGNGTLEFNATLPDYRKKGLGTAVCRAAIKHLVDDGVVHISLRARAEGVSLYTALGSKVYFDF